MDVWTERLLLHGLDREEAAHIVAGVREGDGPWEAWDPDYPLDDELDPLRSMVDGAEPHPVFGLYQVRSREDGRAIGGVCFFGPPDAAGEVEIGYGLVPSETGNTGSRRVLEGTGFIVVATVDGTLHFRRDLLV